MEKNLNPLFLIKDFEVEYLSPYKKLKYEVDFSIYEKEVILFTGISGIGKSTLFFLLKGILSKIYSCKISGNILFYENSLNCKNIIENYPEILDKKIGYLGQNPYVQIVNPKVIDELVFGMENYKFAKDQMNINATKYANLFNLNEKLCNKTSNLSGGFAQRLNLASILSYIPDIILLDEPASFLDLDANKSFYNVIKKLKGQKTILIIEHLFEQIIDIVDRVLIFTNSDGIINTELFNRLKGKEYKIVKVSSKNEISFSDNRSNGYNLNIKIKLKNESQFKNIFEKYSNIKIQNRLKNNISLKVNDVYYRYNKFSSYIFENLNFHFYQGYIIGIVGENGSGKTTLLKLLSKIIKPEKGQIIIYDNNKKINKIHQYISIQFQNPESSFFFPLVKDEISHQLKNFKFLNNYLIDLLYSDFFPFNQHFNRSCFTLSEGEKRRLGFIIQLLMNKPIMLYDEPTYAQDLERVNRMKDIIKYNKEKSKLQIIVSHDFSFLSDISDKIYKIKDKKLVEVK